MRLSATLVSSCLLLALGARTAAGEEVFVCTDKTFVRIDPARRAQQYEHPCVKAWFGAAGAQPAVGEGTRSGDNPQAATGLDEPIKTTRAGRRR